ncbi:hypothetical protein SAMN05660776_0373 [Salegentibacter holothuriorum]|uniref:Uncharacterized protein n=1 Tax=Salegentibacter holothuriorum TaxID=241145 RepID=A0A1T5AAN7_9FLAO|nr:hypothetical protein [Salegentibacter holothuriorum]SKB32071.1 hypothetical protein SAMN05660776_0373 [Salegentibacter holothuriorum]
MKKLILSLLCFTIVGMVYGQGIIKLDELKMEFNPKSLEIDETSNVLTFQVSEDYVGQFHANPLRYAKENFSIEDFIEANQNKGYNKYVVSFLTNKGKLIVNYDKDGEVISSNQRFIDVNLPNKTIVKVLRANEGYRIIGTKHLAYSKSGWTIDKEFYKVKLENGKNRKNVKMNISRDATGVAVATLD